MSVSMLYDCNLSACCMFLCTRRVRKDGSPRLWMADVGCVRALACFGEIYWVPWLLQACFVFVTPTPQKFILKVIMTVVQCTSAMTR